jgi:hypothetical protein
MTCILALGISKAAGKRRKSGALITSDVVESYLRTAYPAESFTKSQLFKNIEDWELRNAPFRLLKR